MKSSFVFWAVIIISAYVFTRYFPSLKFNVIVHFTFVYVVTKFWKYIVFQRVPKTYRVQNNEQRTVIVTGSSSGIGCQIAQHLCRRGFKVIWAARDIRKAQNALNGLVWTPEFGPRGYVLSMDLASKKSIENFVQEFKKRENRLNLLILNAAYQGPYRLTEDGFEQNIGVNHLGHAYLCYLLVDTMKKSAPGRIVAVSSDVHFFCREIPFDDLMFEKNRHSYGVWKAYALSKCLNNLFVKELSKRLEGSRITVHAAHPGTPILTELIRDGALGMGLFYHLFLRPLSFFYCRSPSEAAQTPLFAALAPKCGEKTGLYLENCMEFSPSRLSSDEKIARQMWDTSCELLKINKNWA